MKNNESLSLTDRIGTIVKNLPNLHNTEYTAGINLHTTTLFQKMISKGVLEKELRIKSVDYCKALIFLNYFTEVLENNYTSCDNLSTISKVLREGNEEELADSEIDPQEMPWYLGIRTVVAEVALSAKEKGKEHYSKTEKDNIEKRYNERNHYVDFSSQSIKKSEPYYKAIGQMLLDIAGKDAEKHLENTSSKVELEAIIFTSIISGILKDASCKSKVDDELQKKNYLCASILAIESLSQEISQSTLQSYITGGL